MKLFLTILVAAFAVASADDLVLIHVSSETDVFVCSGSLISNNYVLSAASVIYEAVSVQMFFGKHNRSYVEDSEVQMISTDIILHPEWNLKNMDNDIALIHLPESIEFTPQISPATLPKFSDIGDDYINNEVTVSGWGKAFASSTKLSEVLLQVETQVFENFFCEMVYMGYVHQSLCTRGDGSHARGICTGDSGSPLVKDGVQIGVANLASWYGCAEGWPSVHTRVWSYLDWIAENTDVLIQP